MDKKNLMEKAWEIGFKYEKNYGGCSQCTIAAVQDTLSLRNDFVFKAASGFAGGGGLLRAGFCGGYSGGIMVMSSIFGRRRNKIDNDTDEKYCSFNMAVSLHDKFIKKYESIMCYDIHCKLFGRSYDLWDPEQKELFDQAGAHKDKCTSVVADASMWVTELILDEIQQRGMKLEDFKSLEYIF